MTIEKIKQIASEKYGRDMTDDMAAKYMEKYADKLGKLSDNELDNVSGGCSVGEGMVTDKECTICGEKLTTYTMGVWECENCKKVINN